MNHSIIPAILETLDEMIAIRHHLHENPEIGFEEFKTSQLVAEKLQEYGFEVTQGIGGTGVVGEIKNGEGKRIGIRADMDALPILEVENVPHASKIKGKMHGCGHDGHTTSLLTAARYLAKTRNFKGTLNVIFQPAEEGLGGGKAMLEDELFTRFPCDLIFGFHNTPGVPTGKIGFHRGAMLASGDNVTVTIQGTGGHGGMPHLAIDPVVVAASIVMALQTVVARNVNPLEAGVITVGSIQAGEVHNIIPDQAILKLNVRALTKEVRALLKKRICEVVEFQAKSFNTTAEIDYRNIFPILVNDDEATDLAESVARKTFGDEAIVPHFPQATGSEDFAFMLERCRGAYFCIGNGTDGPHGYSVHNPHYDFNDEIIPIAATMWARLVESYLQ